MAITSNYNGIIKCNVNSVPGTQQAWYAEVTFLTSLIEIDDIFVLWHEFPFREHLFLTTDDIRIGIVKSLNYLRVLCHWFSIYVIQIIRHVDAFSSFPIHWTSDNIDAWKEKCEKIIEEEGV